LDAEYAGRVKKDKEVRAQNMGRLQGLAQVAGAAALGIGIGYYAFNEPLKQYALEQQARDLAKKGR